MSYQNYQKIPKKVCKKMKMFFDGAYCKKQLFVEVENCMPLDRVLPVVQKVMKNFCHWMSLYR